MLTSRINISLLIDPLVRNLERCTILTAYVLPVERLMALRTVAKEPCPSLGSRIHVMGVCDVWKGGC